MTQPVVLPLWLFVLLLLLALLAALQWFLLPGVRWVVRRKVRRVLDEIQLRLNIELPQFKLTRRRALIDRLESDPRVLAAAQQQVQETGEPAAQVARRVHVYAQEIVPAFNAYVYFRLGYWLAKTFARMIYRVRLGYTDEKALAAINPRSTVVFVMNHRSNMDYILVSFLAAEKVALSYAVGEWARIWPLQGLIRAMGAYFVRRNSGDALYRMVLQRYVQMATEGGVPQAMYPEGGLSVDGRLRAPKLGLLDYMLKGFSPDAERDLVFIPVGINYDRVIEDRSLLRKLDATPAPAGLWRTLRVTGGFVGRQALFTLLGRTLRVTGGFVGRQALFTLLGRRYRFGYACVNFGRPVSMREHVKSLGIDFRTQTDVQRREAVAIVGQRLMQEIGQIVPVLPVPLVARVMLREPGRGLSPLELKAAVQALMEQVEGAGGHVYVPRGDREYAIDVGLRMLTLRRLVIEEDSLLRANPGEMRALAYYANSIAHLGEADVKTGPEGPVPG